MAKRAGGNNFSVSVEGLERLAALPGFIEHGQRELLDKAVGRLGDEVRRRAPGGPHSKVARDIESRTLTSTTGVIRSKGLKATKALDQGAFIKPKKKGGVLAFRGRDGETVFTRKPVRLAPRHFFRKGLRSRGRIVREAYHEAFGDITRGL